MSYHEKRSIVSIISSLLIFGAYSMYVFGKYREGGPVLANDLSFWATAFLILIPVSIAANIIIHIVFSIINTIATNECEPSFSDERDKLIELKSIRNSHWVFVLGFFLAMGSLVLNMPPAVMFIVIAVSGLVSSLVGDFSQLYYYRRGI